MNINIDNLPDMSEEFEYCFGPVPFQWIINQGTRPFEVCHESGWSTSARGDSFGQIYRRPKPAPEPEPEPESENITLPVFWDATCPRVATVDEKGYAPVLRDAFVGLLHIAHGREYRLSRFLFPDGASLRFSVDENFGGATKATHARFYLVK